MKAEARELYVYTIDHYEKDIQRIRTGCAAPLPEVRRVVKKAMDKYILDYCGTETEVEDIFSQEDFEEVSQEIFSELKEEE